MKKLLLTGFEPFGGESVNPSWETVSRAAAEGFEVRKVCLPVTFDGAAQRICEEIRSFDPDVLVMVGQAGGRKGVTVERVAINLADARIPDNAGAQPEDAPLAENAPAAYFSTLPTREMVRAITEQGIPAALSYSAGTYVCNCLLYTLLHTAAVEYPGMPGGFIHVPYALEQLPGKPEGTPGLALQQIAQGLSCAIEAIAEAWT